MKHYTNMISALGGAMQICTVWQLIKEKDEGPSYYNARDIYGLAMELGGDEENLGENAFYSVSEEGAIGISMVYEYLTHWIFIPVDEPEIRDRELERLKIELEFDDAVDSGRMSEEQARDYYSPQYAKVTGQNIEIAQSSLENGFKYCRNCGKQIKMSAKFCRNCGNKCN